MFLSTLSTPTATRTAPAHPSEETPTKKRINAQTAGIAVELFTTFLEAIGPALTEEARRQIISGLLRRHRPKRQADRGITIARLCKLYCKHAVKYYGKPDGNRTSEASSVEFALRPLRKLFGRSRVADFGPRKLCQVRQGMIERGWCRRQINQQVGRIKRMFRWGVENELIPPSAFHGVQAVQGLRAGRSEARESLPVKPVPEPMIDAVLPFASPQVKAMIQTQLLTGMRPGEVCIMRTCDIDTNQQPWVYRPEHHKTEHHHHERNVFLGPKSQEIVRPFLKTEKPTKYLFSPADADRIRRKRLHAQRKTPLSCGNRPGTNRKRRPKRSPGNRYDTASYRRAITYASEAAFPVPDGLDDAQAKKWRREHNWHPHQLRHNAATKLRKDFGIDVAQVVLGHKTLAVTQVYAEKNVESAQRVMLAAG